MPRWPKWRQALPIGVAPLVAAWLHVGVRSEQLRGDLGVALLAGDVKRRVALVVGLVHVSVRSEQRRDDLGVAMRQAKYSGVARIVVGLIHVRSLAGVVTTPAWPSWQATHSACCHRRQAAPVVYDRRVGNERRSARGRRARWRSSKSSEDLVVVGRRSACDGSGAKSFAGVVTLASSRPFSAGSRPSAVAVQCRYAGVRGLRSYYRYGVPGASGHARWRRRTRRGAAAATRRAPRGGTAAAVGRLLSVRCVTANLFLS